MGVVQVVGDVVVHHHVVVVVVEVVGVGRCVRRRHCCVCRGNAVVHAMLKVIVQHH